MDARCEPGLNDPFEEAIDDALYSGVLPDKISIFRGPITRLAAGDADRLRREVRHVVLHEIAHHFGSVTRG
jgi:predicted Zn-dependent protease with MMP-like domain